MRTGLFRSAGRGRVAFAHKSYSEFLAALYIVRRRMPLDQLRGMLFTLEDAEWRAVPQLGETVAWLACSRADVFDVVLETEPEVLLRSDAAALTDDQKKEFLDRIFRRLDRREISHESIIADADLLARLKHPNLSG